MDDNGLRTGAAECTVCRKNTLLATVYTADGGAPGGPGAFLRVSP